MFQPNSIRSLLKKRNMTKLTSQTQISKSEPDQMSKTMTDFSSISKNNTDPDLQSILQAKLMIKQIDHQVENIRTWRQNQKTLLHQKMKNNSELVNVSNEEYEKFIVQKMAEQEISNKKIIQKMKIQKNKHKHNANNNSSVVIDNSNSQTLQSSQAGQIAYQDWQNNFYDPQLMTSIANGQQKINQKKHLKIQGGDGMQDKHIAFLNSISELSLSDVISFNKKQNSQNQNYKQNKLFDKDKLKQQLDDIDRELLEMEELLK